MYMNNEFHYVHILSWIMNIVVNFHSFKSTKLALGKEGISLLNTTYSPPRSYAVHFLSDFNLICQ